MNCTPSAPKSNDYYSKLRAPLHRHSENIISRKTPPRQSSNMKRTSTYYVQSQAKPNQYEHTRVSGAKNSQSHRVVLQPSPQNRALVIIFASRHSNRLQTYPPVNSSHGKSCGSTRVQVRYGNPPSRKSSSKKLRIRGLTASFALFLTSSTRLSKRLRFSLLY